MTKYTYKNKTITVRESTYYTLLAIKKRSTEHEGRFVSFSDVINDLIETAGRVIADENLKIDEVLHGGDPLAAADYYDEEQRRLDGLK